jgi:hypothetical protein
VHGGLASAITKRIDARRQRSQIAWQNEERQGWQNGEALLTVMIGICASLVSSSMVYFQWDVFPVGAARQGSLHAAPSDGRTGRSTPNQWAEMA